MNGPELLATTLGMCLPALLDMIGMAAFGGIIVAALCEWTAHFGKKALLDKYAQQTAAMALLLMIITVIGSAAVAIPAMDRFPGLRHWLTSPNSPMFHGLAACAVAIVFLLVWSPTWKKMRPLKTLHALFGMIAAVAALAAVAICTIAGALLLPALKAENAPIWPQNLPDHIWAFIGQYILTAMAVGAGLSIGYLILRRSRDDFGRDYYRFGLKKAATWAFLPMIFQFAFQGWLFATLTPAVREMILGGPLGILWGVSLVCAVVCIVIWMTVARSETPMRHKWAAVLGAILLWVMHTANAVLFLNISALPM